VHIKASEGTARRRGQRSGQRADRHRPKAAPKRVTAPAQAPPSTVDYSLGGMEPARVGVPSFFIDSFRIPPFLLPIYQAAASQYGVCWEVLAAINEVETDYGHNVDVSSAGAVGWMQFMPASWATYGVDANGDGVKDPYNPVDAIFAAARYLRAAGGDRDIRRAVLAYNHADWYADSVLLRAQIIAGLPGDLVDSLTGLAQGRYPVAAKATYTHRRLYSRAGALVVAVNDARVVEVRRQGRRWSSVTLRDAYGNAYIYRHIRRLARTVRSARRVAGGAVVGRLGTGAGAYLHFEIRPAGGPRIDPKPILAGWRLLGSSALHHPVIAAPSAGNLFTLSNEQLMQRVLQDTRIGIYACGIADIRSGRIDRRVLAALEFLATSGLRPTVSSLECGHGHLTSSGNVSEHSAGTAVDISAVNGIPITPSTQGKGSIAETTIRRLLTLQGAMKPHQIISLMTFAGADNTLAMPDHDDHIHVGWRPIEGQPQGPIKIVMEPEEWGKLMDRIGDIDNPAVRGRPSRFAVKVRKAD
jgi:hypothetical protein